MAVPPVTELSDEISAPSVMAPMTSLVSKVFIAPTKQRRSQSHNDYMIEGCTLHAEQYYILRSIMFLVGSLKHPPRCKYV